MMNRLDIIHECRKYCLCVGAGERVIHLSPYANCRHSWLTLLAMTIHVVCRQFNPVPSTGFKAAGLLHWLAAGIRGAIIFVMPYKLRVLGRGLA